MRYIDYVNATLRSLIKEKPETVIFGQNVTAGSRISGLTKQIPEDTGCIGLNTPNGENTLVGMGFGMMLGGLSSIFFMKQLDFLLLGIDPMVNTYNLIRIEEPTASFTIFPVVTDIGYQGLQSSLNAMDDFCSISRTEGYVITNRHDGEAILARHLLAPGFRTIAVSQRLFGETVISFPEGAIDQGSDAEWFQYEAGTEATIACFNFSLPQGVELHGALKEKGVSASLFSVNRVAADEETFAPIAQDARRTGKLYILDDGKSVNLSSQGLATIVSGAGVEVTMLRRDFSGDWLRPTEERLVIPDTALAGSPGSVRH